MASETADNTATIAIRRRKRRRSLRSCGGSTASEWPWPARGISTFVLRFMLKADDGAARMPDSRDAPAKRYHSGRRYYTFRIFDACSRRKVVRMLRCLLRSVILRRYGKEAELLSHERIF